MGGIRHHALIVTGWQHDALAALAAFAEEIGCEVLQGHEVVNGYRTMCITPDGSTEGWDASNEGDVRRAQVKRWLSARPDWHFAWCEVAYGNDDGEAIVTDDAWPRLEAADQSKA